MRDEKRAALRRPCAEIPNPMPRDKRRAENSMEICFLNPRGFAFLRGLKSAGRLHKVYSIPMIRFDVFPNPVILLTLWKGVKSQSSESSVSIEVEKNLLKFVEIRIYNLCPGKRSQSQVWPFGLSSDHYSASTFLRIFSSFLPPADCDSDGGEGHPLRRPSLLKRPTERHRLPDCHVDA